MLLAGTAWRRHSRRATHARGFQNVRYPKKSPSLRRKQMQRRIPSSDRVVTVGHPSLKSNLLTFCLCDATSTPPRAGSWFTVGTSCPLSLLAYRLTILQYIPILCGKICVLDPAKLEIQDHRGISRVRNFPLS